MRSLSHLFDNNRAWWARIRRAIQDFLAKLSRRESPDIRGSDARTALAAP
jgi:hypothetical protein